MKQTFDHFAADYDQLLDEGLRVSGETKTFFARERVGALQKQLERRGLRAESVMDFGCGTGSATPYLFEILEAKKILGLDVSGQMIDVARQNYGSARARFMRLDEFEARGDVDLVYCNGVFHHIPPGQRDAALDLIKQSLAPQGILSFWENNPWNPGTTYIMRRCAFDKDAEMISSPKATKSIKHAGLEILNVAYHFIFPRMLRAFRVLEPLVQSVPLGAQYHVLARNRG